ncbi:MAG: PAS domain-containing protein, partial [Verrucomicrobiota bacterium]
MKIKEKFKPELKEATARLNRPLDFLSDLDTEFERLDLATDIATVGIWDWDMARNETHCSRAYHRLYGLPSDAPVPSYDEWLNRVHPEDREMAAADVQRAIDSREPYFTEFRVIWPDESIHWLKGRGRVIYNERGSPVRMVGVNIEVTSEAELMRRHQALLDSMDEIKRVEESLRESEGRLQSLFEGVYDLVFVYDRNGIIMDCNSACFHHLGYTRQEFLSLTTRDIEQPAFAEEFQERLYIQSTEGRLRVEGVFIARDDREVHMDILTSVIHYFGQSSFLAVCRDITASKKAEEEQRALERQMLQAQKLESLGVLAGGIAHDFNNILMSVMGCAELVKEDVLPDSPAMEYTRQIESSAKFAAELCQQMMAYAGKGHFDVEPANLNDLLD